MRTSASHTSLLFAFVAFESAVPHPHPFWLPTSRQPQLLCGFPALGGPGFGSLGETLAPHCSVRPGLSSGIRGPRPALISRGLCFLELPPGMSKVRRLPLNRPHGRHHSPLCAAGRSEGGNKQVGKGKVARDPGHAVCAPTRLLPKWTDTLMVLTASVTNRWSWR